MLWREVDISTFPTEMLRGWVDELKEEIKMIRGEIDRRWATDQSTAEGAPPRREETGG